MHQKPPSRAEPRTGYVTLVGTPNAGKSTLLNALVGERLSIVTPKAQTTWRRIVGIHSTDQVQMIVLDTPGLLNARDLLHRSMLGAAYLAVEEADVVLLVLDASAEEGPGDRTIVKGALGRSRAPLLVAVNKIDAASRDRIDALQEWASVELGGSAFPVSALTGAGVEELRAALEGSLPEGPFLYPPDELATEPVRFFVAELIRETVFEQFEKEVPYSVFCQVEEFRESQDPVYILANVFVERASQKRILIGHGGQAIRELGKSARGKIEAFTNRRVYLDLWVKVLPDWRRKRAQLHRLGFRVPDSDEPVPPS